jgi:hypothetical protein
MEMNSPQNLQVRVRSAKQSLRIEQPLRLHSRYQSFHESVVIFQQTNALGAPLLQFGSLRHFITRGALAWLASLATATLGISYPSYSCFGFIRFRDL